MDGRERIKRIISGEKADRCGFWMGNPHADTWPIYFKHFGIANGGDSEESLRRRMGDDLRWICPELFAHMYKHPRNKPLWDNQHDPSKGLASAGVFADCEDPAEVDKFPWPNPDYYDFREAVQTLKNTGPYYRLGGMGCPFFHIVADFFGMENYFVKMHTDPEVVEAVTRRVCEFYLETNERFFEQAGGELDGFFFLNDFGSQLNLLISPEFFDHFM